MYEVFREIAVTRHACVVMAAAACEVFPKECCGMLCNDDAVVIPVPFQVARRQREEVESGSYEFFDVMFGRGPCPIGSFHSHTKLGKRDRLFCTPSETDLENMDVGDVEIIVCISQNKRIRPQKIYRRGMGIQVRVGKYKISMRCFLRTSGFNRQGIPKYRCVPMRLK